VKEFPTTQQNGEIDFSFLLLFGIFAGQPRRKVDEVNNDRDPHHRRRASAPAPKDPARPKVVHSTILNIAGVFSGVVLALALRSSREEKWTQREIVYVGFVGKSHDLEPVITG
jgi:hypothetical protein